MTVDPIANLRSLVSTPRIIVPDSFVTGTYVGNNIADTAIDWGFPADLVIVKGDTTEYAVFRTSAHQGDSTSYLANAVANATGLIKQLTSTGMIIGTTAGINTNGVTYHYTAIRKNGGILLDVGFYNGNGVDDREIYGLPWKPDFLFIKRNGVANGVFRDSLDVGDVSHQPTANSNPTDCIQALSDNGFQVGTNALVNANGSRYEYFAFKINDFCKIGTYTGNGNDNRNLTGIGITPDLFLTKRDGASSLTYRDSSLVGDLSVSFNNSAYFANGIQDFINDGVQLGNSSGVNTNATVYHYLALKKGSRRRQISRSLI